MFGAQFAPVDFYGKGGKGADQNDGGGDDKHGTVGVDLGFQFHEPDGCGVLVGIDETARKAR